MGLVPDIQIGDIVIGEYYFDEVDDNDTFKDVVIIVSKPFKQIEKWPNYNTILNFDCLTEDRIAYMSLQFPPDRFIKTLAIYRGDKKIYEYDKKRE